MKRIIPVLILALLGCACSQGSAPLVASDVVVSKPIPGMSMAAGYLTLSNNASQPIIITQVTSPQFESVEMHESVIEDGMARMYPLGDLMVLAKSVRRVPAGRQAPDAPAAGRRIRHGFSRFLRGQGGCSDR